jgi:hypothetical protein
MHATPARRIGHFAWALFAATLGPGCATGSAARETVPGHYACRIPGPGAAPMDEGLRQMFRTAATAEQLARAARHARSVCIDDATHACYVSQPETGRSGCLEERVARCEASYREARDLIACR